MSDLQSLSAPAHGLLQTFLNLPAEIVELVLHQLEPEDILSVRLVNHSLHALVHEPEHRIYSILNSKLWTEHGLRHRIQVSETERTLTKFFDTYRRHRAIALIAETLATHISGFCRPRVGTLHDRAKRQTWRGLLAARLTEKLISPLIILDTFLAKLSTVFRQGDLDLQDLSDEAYIGLHDIYLLDQQKIIRELKLDVKDIVRVTRAWLILDGVLDAHRWPVARQANGDCVTKASIRTLLVVQGLFPFRRLLDAEQSLERNRILFSATSCIGPGTPWRSEIDSRVPTINPLGYRKQEQLYPRFMVRSNDWARCQLWTEQDIWIAAARTEIMRLSKQPASDIKITRWMEKTLSKVEGPEVQLSAGWNTLPNLSTR